MLIAFLKNIMLMAEYASSPTVIYSDMQPVDDENNLLMTFNLKAMPKHVAGGTPSITVKAMGSNDGLDWQDVSGFTTGAVTGPGINTVEDTIGYAFVRFHISLDDNGVGAGDWVAAIFDLHGNFSKT